MASESGIADSVSSRLGDGGLGWWLFGTAMFAVVAWIGYRYLGWIVFGLFTYYVGRPITRRLQRHLSARTLTAGLTLAFIIVPILVFIAAFLGVALGQALEILSSDAVMTIAERFPLPTTDLPTEPIDLVLVILDDPQLSTILGQFGVAIGSFTAILYNVFLSLIFAFFLLVEDRRLAEWFERRVFGPDSLTADYLRRVDRGLKSVYFGYTLTIFVVIVLAAIIYTVFNMVVPSPLQIPFALLLAAVTGFFTLIPLVGRTIVYAFIVALLALQAYDVNRRLLWIPALLFVFMIVVFDNVVRTYIRPYLSGKSYHMALVMFAYLLGPALFGWYGIFMGPLLMVFVVEFVVDILPRLAGADEIGVTGAGPEGSASGEGSAAPDDPADGGDASSG